MAAGHGGQVLVSESTRALVAKRVRLRDLGEHRLKDLSEPKHLYQLEIDGLAAVHQILGLDCPKPGKRGRTSRYDHNILYSVPF